MTTNAASRVRDGIRACATRRRCLAASGPRVRSDSRRSAGATITFASVFLPQLPADTELSPGEGKAHPKSGVTLCPTAVRPAARVIWSPTACGKGGEDQRAHSKSVRRRLLAGIVFRRPDIRCQNTTTYLSMSPAIQVGPSTPSAQNCLVANTTRRRRFTCVTIRLERYTSTSRISAI